MFATAAFTSAPVRHRRALVLCTVIACLGAITSGCDGADNLGEVDSAGGDPDQGDGGQGHEADKSWDGGDGTDGDSGGEDGGGDDDGNSGIGVGQGGSQDFGQFRSILLAGQIPGPTTIDDVGFFNEHKVEFPNPECGADVCIHGMLGVMGNFISGSPCTMVVVGLNTAIDPSKLERPPLNLSIVVDTSGSMKGEPIDFVRTGLRAMLSSLEIDDRISLISFDDRARVLAEYLPGDATQLALAIESLQASDGSTNLHDGLQLGYETVNNHADPRFQNRVILLSDGEATAGDTSAESITLLAADYGREGLGLTTMGVGERFDAPLMRRLAETGWGSFYFLDDPRAVTEVFTEEVTSFMIPLAQDVKISADIESGYNLRAVYGTKLEVTLNNETEISIPILQIAHRESANDTGKGRRGGGGAIILETIPNGGETAAVGNLRFEYSVPGTDERIIQRVEINSPLRPGEVPEDGFFSGPQVAKAFVMLNIYAAFELAAVSADVREDAKAIAILEAARDGVLNWLASNDDRDIEDDVRYLDLFVANLRNRPGGVDDDNDDCCEDIDTWPHD